MLDIRNVKVNFDRSVEPYSIDIGMQHENGIVRLDFEFDEKFNLTNEYLYFMVTDDGRTLVYPIIDNSVVIGSEITQKKRYVANIVVSKNEIIDELNKNYIVWISKDVILTITANSIITGALSPEVLPVQLQIVYDDLFDLKADLTNKLESGYFKGEKGDPGEQGPKGDKGDKGDPGKDGSGAVTKENIKTALGENPLIQPSTAQIGQIFKVQSINEDGTLGLEAVDMPNCDDIEGQVSKLKGDLDSFTHIERSPNLFNKDDANITSNAQIISNGEVAVNAAWRSFVTDFIKINATESRTLRQTLDTNIRIAEYKADGTFIGITTINISSPMTLNNETEKIRIEFYGSSRLMVYQSDTKLPYEDYYVNIIVNEDSIPTAIARKNDVEYEMTNYMLFAEVYEGYNKYVDGVLKTEQWWKATSMVKLDKAYNMYSPAANGNAVFFDDNKKYISTVEFKYNIPVMKSAYPENAVYVAFSYQVSYMQSYNNVMYVIRTDNNNRQTRKFYPTTKKEVGKRPRIDIYTTDSQDAILWKLADAFLTRDCDVYFENGTYVFDDVFVDLKEKYEYANYFELPIGGNCRYYFNGSTLICNVDKFKANGYSGVVDLLSCIYSATSESYELCDGTLINNGGIYVVHDECGGKPNWYSHRYKNMRFQYNSLDQANNIRKCVGGGTGLFGESIFENCTFETDSTYDLSFHGIATDKEDIADFKLVLSNCYLSKRISLDNLATNQTASLLMSGCSAKYIHQTGVNNKWDVTSWCNEVRSE